MSREAELWKLMKPHMLGHVIRMENYLGPGQPDVNGCFDCTEWWCELKVIERLPVRPTTVVKIDHFTPEQRVWLVQRSMVGGRSFMFVRVDHHRDFFLFKGLDAAHHVGKDWVSDHWKTEAIGWWKGRVNWVEFNKLVLGRR